MRPFRGDRANHKPAVGRLPVFGLASKVGLSVFAGLLSIASLSPYDSAIAADDSQILQEVFTAWARRQEETRSARFEWEQETIRPNRDPGPRESGKMTTAQRFSVLRLDGSRLDYRVRTPEGDSVDMPTVYRSAYDGEVSQRLSGRGSAPDPGWAEGIVTDVPHEFDINNVDTRPILLAYRAVHPTMLNLRPEDYRLTAKGGTIEGRSCVIIQEKEKKRIQKSYWIDMRRDCIILRYASRVNGRDSILQDISYQQDSQHGWVPARWKMVFVHEDGSLGVSKTYRMTEYAINEPIPLEEFQIEFPVGTNVEDRVAGRTYYVEPPSRRRWLRIVVPLAFVAVVALIVAARRFVARGRRDARSV